MAPHGHLLPPNRLLLLLILGLLIFIALRVSDGHEDRSASSPAPTYAAPVSDDSPALTSTPATTTPPTPSMTVFNPPNTWGNPRACPNGFRPGVPATQAAVAAMLG